VRRVFCWALFVLSKFCERAKALYGGLLALSRMRIANMYEDNDIQIAREAIRQSAWLSAWQSVLC